MTLPLAKRLMWPRSIQYRSSVSSKYRLSITVSSCTWEKQLQGFFLNARVPKWSEFVFMVRRNVKNSERCGWNSCRWHGETPLFLVPLAGVRAVFASSKIWVPFGTTGPRVFFVTFFSLVELMGISCDEGGVHGPRYV